MKAEQKQKQKDLGTYPEIKTTYNWYRHFKGKGTGYKEFEEYDEAIKFLKKNKDHQIYTEIEGETGTTYYDRGFHICNRTGWYAIVKDPRYQVMTYTGDL